MKALRMEEAPKPEWCYACIEQHEQAEGTAALWREETKRLIGRVEAHMLSHATEEWDAMFLESKLDAMLLSPAARRRVQPRRMRMRRKLTKQRKPRSK